ncbi:MAG: hypothetical protein JWR58_6201 [Pseudonocardia sp.]|nr:hypothetical protein [Pseudonocardia sp.]
MLFLSWRTDVQLAELLTGSLVRLVGSTFLPAHVDGTNTAWWIQEDATFVLLAHDTSADRPFGYANRTAQRCLEYDWDEFVEMPSRLSAAAPNREERRLFMDGVLARATSDYRGLRIACSVDAERRNWTPKPRRYTRFTPDGRPLPETAILRRPPFGTRTRPSIPLSARCRQS